MQYFPILFSAHPESWALIWAASYSHIEIDHCARQTGGQNPGKLAMNASKLLIMDEFPHTFLVILGLALGYKRKPAPPLPGIPLVIMP